MKKISTILSAIFASILILNPVSAKNVNNFFNTTLEKTNDLIEESGTFDINLKINALFNLKGLDAAFDFNSDKLKFLGYDCHADFTCTIGDRFVADGLNGLSGEYILATFHFKLADDFDMNDGDRIKFYDINGTNDTISADTYIDIGTYIESEEETEEETSDPAENAEEDNSSDDISTPDTGTNLKQKDPTFFSLACTFAGVAISSCIACVIFHNKETHK